MLSRSWFGGVRFFGFTPVEYSKSTRRLRKRNQQGENPLKSTKKTHPNQFLDARNNISTYQHITQPTEPIVRPIDRPTNQPANQPTNQPTSKQPYVHDCRGVPLVMTRKTTATPRTNSRNVSLAISGDFPLSSCHPIEASPGSPPPPPPPHFCQVYPGFPSHLFRIGSFLEGVGFELHGNLP